MEINVKQASVSFMSWRSLFIFLMILVLMFSMVTPSRAVITEAAILVPVVIAALAAFGISTSVYALQSGDVISWYSQKLESWASSLGESVNSLLDLAKVSTSPLGVLSLAPSFLLKVKQFAQWLTSDTGVVAGGQPVQVISGTFSNQPIPYVNPLNTTEISSAGLLVLHTKGWDLDMFCGCNQVGAGKTLCFAVVNGSNYDIYCVSSINGVQALVGNVRQGGSVKTLSSTTTVNGHVVYYSSCQTNISITQLYLPSYNTLQEGLSAASDVLVYGDSSMSISSDSIVYPETTGDDEEDYPYVIDYGGVPGDTVQDASDTIMDKVIDNELVVEGETDAPDEAVDWPDIMSPPQVEGLDDVFPFCIPFDIYHFLQALAATPVAPRFEIPFYIPNLINYTMVIDLSGFNAAAQVLRTMELLAFCIGLAFVTRKLIRG